MNQANTDTVRREEMLRRLRVDLAAVNDVLVRCIDLPPAAMARIEQVRNQSETFLRSVNQSPTPLNIVTIPVDDMVVLLGGLKAQIGLIAASSVYKRIAELEAGHVAV